MRISRISDLFLNTARSGLERANLALRHPTLLAAAEDYKFSDERMKFVHILECINYLRVAGVSGRIPPVYFEFGCHSGRTFSAAINAARYLRLENAQFYAFDSFQGLPATAKEEDGFFEEGSFATSRQMFADILARKTGQRIDAKNIIEGFYSSSLTDVLQASMPQAGVVHIDVDLYSSTKEVMKFIKPLLVVGTVLLFDDWYCFPPGANQGEVRAMREFQLENPDFDVEEWKNYSTFGKSFFVTRLP